MNPGAISALLQQRIGLDPASLGPSVLSAAVAERQRATGTTGATYLALLAEPQEFQQLVEHLVVPETWFFRGAGLFEALAEHVRSSSRARPLCALSLACSTGEEPYSLAMALAEAGVNADQCTIDGIDLSPRSLDAAQRCVYRELSFRQMEPKRRERHFRAAADGWELNAAIRDRVRFRVGNLAAPDLLATESGRYDLILCRNVLIYLTPTARRQALDTVERLLTPDGLLAIGHAEPQLLAGRPFERAGGDGHFLFRRSNALASGAGDGPALRAKRAKKKVVRATATTGAITVPARPEAVAEPPLAAARRLADANQLDAALAECQRLLQRGPAADTFSLLGVIQQARGDTAAAAEAFRKALYLDPDHREALTHGALLAEGRGDAARARALRERLARDGGDA